jgi:BMFP domain-containing protein YqiC
MQKDSKLFDDVARMMSGASAMVFDMKSEVESSIARHMEQFFSKTSLVTREEFEIVRAMVIEARAHNEALNREIQQLREALAVATATDAVASPKPPRAPKKSSTYSASQ